MFLLIGFIVSCNGIKPKIDKSEYFRQQGLQYEKLNKNVKALKSYENALIYNPNDYRTFANQGFLYYKMVSTRNQLIVIQKLCD